MLSVQDAIVRLTSFWMGQGCVLGQPYNSEVGAGTLNPGTFLRVLGPEPWRTVYVEPSVRPDDSRYGDNPNRMQTHTQVQVILKPDPGDPQELYLQSLKALGIDTRSHDVRFVEDNWESPALGAWGLGWEVWLDGLEITQFTYFQQAGGLTLDPSAVEITYGLERILMALQGVRHFKELAFTDSVSYGEIQGEAELEMSTYYLDEADVEANRQLFAIYEAEAQRMIERGLPLPAHNYVLKCSHAFNVLDSRGAVGATERARAFARMRGLAHDVAVSWVKRREELGFPLGEWQLPESPVVEMPAGGPGEPATLLLEIGSEELPPREVDAGIAQLGDAVRAALTEARLAHGSVEASGTPRRLVVTVDGVAPRQPDRELSVRGPRADVAFGPDGTPTPAAAGFARKQGLDVDDLSRRDDGGATYVYAERSEPGRPAVEVLAEALSDVVASLRFGRTMRWGAGRIAYPRPLRWITAMLGDTVIPFAHGTVVADRRTSLLRDDPSPVVELDTAGRHRDVVAERGIVVDVVARRAMVVAEAQRVTSEVGAVVDVDGEASLVDEITNLVEVPVAILGRFEEEFLDLPPEVLTVVMRKHQRYLPVWAPTGELLPYFVAIANGPVDADVVRAGNEAVLRARYADAAFFFNRDVPTRLTDVRPKLAALVFEERAGSMLDRAERTGHVAGWLADAVDLAAEDRAVLERAGFLAKADLATEMVVEMSSLAGQMGRIYAVRQGESPAVADAIFDHVLPRFAGDRLPGSLPGALLAMADRADVLVALFAVGAQPTGSADPYGLRRAALGLVQVQTQWKVAVDLRDLFAAAAKVQPNDIGSGVLDELQEFVARRLEQRLVDDGHPVDVVRAALRRAHRPDLVATSVAELRDLVGSESFRAVAAATNRCARIAAKADDGDVDRALLDEPVEVALWTAYRSVASGLPAEPSLTEFVDRYQPLIEPVDLFFEDVLVMADDPAVRTNRLRVLRHVAQLGEDLLAWGELAET